MAHHSFVTCSQGQENMLTGILLSMPKHSVLAKHNVLAMGDGLDVRRIPPATVAIGEQRREHGEAKTNEEKELFRRHCGCVEERREEIGKGKTLMDGLNILRN